MDGRLAVGRPVVGYEFVDPVDRVVRDSRQHIAEPGGRIDLDQLAGEINVRRIAAVFPILSLPKNVQLLRPAAIPRIDRSVRLLSIARSPSWQ
jgi:hypothetical protein